MDHGYSNNTTGHHFRDLIESHKLETGCYINLFSNKLPTLPECIPPSWISHPWTLIRDNNLSIEEVTVNIQTEQQNYSFTMEDFITAGIEE